MTTSPPWQMDAWDLAGDFTKVAQQWDAIRECLVDLPTFELGDASVSGWTCGEQAGHLALVTNGIASGIEANLADPKRDTDGEWTEPTEAILREGDFPRGIARSPEHVDPRGRPRQEFLAALNDAERRWSALREQAEQISACPGRFPHFALGYMTSSEWVRFCALHSAHHLAVVRDIRDG